MNWDKYLERINYCGGLEPSLENLKLLQETHQRNIPFENLDIHYGVKINLDIPRIYHKIVNNKRGGFCYELNGLYYHLLKYLGYEVIMISARVHSKTRGYGREYDHLTIIVKIGEREYITDVGYGEFAFHPLAIEKNTLQQDPRAEFIMDAYDEEYIRIRKVEGEGFNPEYIFTRKERRYDEFSEMCHYQQTSSEAHFTQKKMITRPISNGRITLTSDLLKIRKDKSIEEFSVQDDTSFDHLLLQYFNISIENNF